MNTNTDLLGQALMPLINSAITAEFEKFDIEKKLSDSLLDIGLVVESMCYQLALQH